MRNSLLIGLLAFPLLAQTPANLRYGPGAGSETGGIAVTGCTNATPIVVTYASAHGLLVDDVVTIHGQRGNTACNGTHKVKVVVSGTQISLKTLAGADVAGSGVWVSSNQNAIGGKATPVTIDAGPVGYLDGWGGKETRRVRCGVEAADPCLVSLSVTSNVATATVASGWTDELTAGVSKVGVWASATTALNATYTITTKGATTITFPTSGVADGAYAVAPISLSKLAYTGNPAWDRLLTVATSWAGLDQAGQDSRPPDSSDSSFTKAVAAALVWFVDRTTTMRDKALYLIRRPEDAVSGTVACQDPTQNYCGAGDFYRPFSLDYARISLPRAAFAANLLWNEASGAEQTAFLNKMFTMKDDGSGCTFPTWTAGVGTISVTGTTVTGTGMLSVPVDAALMIDGVGETSLTRVITAGDPATIHASPGNYTNVNFHWARKWQTGDCGLMSYIRYHPGTPFGSAEQYGPSAGSLSGTIQHQNLQLTSGYGSFMSALPMAERDTRAKQLLEDAFAFVADYPLAFAMTTWRGGWTQAGSLYGDNRSPWYMGDIVWNLENSMTGYPSITGDWLRKEFALWKVYGQSPHGSTPYNTLFGEGTNAPTANGLGGGYRVWRRHSEDLDECGHLQGYVNRQATGDTNTLFSSAYVSEDQGSPAFNFFLAYNPNKCTPTAPSLTARIAASSSARTACLAAGFKRCGPADTAYNWASSRTGTGFTTSGGDTLVQAVAGPLVSDHEGFVTGRTYISKGAAGGTTPCLLGDDASTCSTAAFNFTALGTQTTVKVASRYVSEGLPTALGGIIDKGKVDGASNRYAAWRTNMNAEIITPAPTRSNRWVVHMKNSADIVFVVDDFLLPSSAEMKAFWHLSQNGGAGEGTTTCDGGCSTSDIVSGRIISQSLTNTLVMQHYSPQGDPLRVDVADGSYSGGNNFSFRLTTGPSTNDTQMETVIINKLLVGTGSTALTSSSITVTDWYGAEADGHVVLVARGGASPTAASFTHVATGDVLFAGVAAGTYDVSRNGTPVCTNQVTTSAESVVYCPGVASGTVTLSESGAPLPIDITTTTLPNGTVGVAYSQALSITGGTPPYNCSITVGSLPTGISMSTLGAFTGTPTIAGTSNFTASCTDSLSATPDTAALSITIDAAPVGGNPVTLREGILVRGSVTIR